MLKFGFIAEDEDTIMKWQKGYDCRYRMGDGGIYLTPKAVRTLSLVRCEDDAKILEFERVGHGVLFRKSLFIIRKLHRLTRTVLGVSIPYILIYWSNCETASKSW